MSYEHREGYGSLFKEANKKSEKGPDYRGTVMVGGVVYEIAGWLKAGAKGNFLSLKATPQEERAKEAVGRQNSRQEDPEIPF